MTRGQFQIGWDPDSGPTMMDERGAIHFYQRSMKLLSAVLVVNVGGDDGAVPSQQRGGPEPRGSLDEIELE